MAVNNDGNLVDTSGNVAVDFVWGNFPMQPNDDRTDGTAVSVVASSTLTATLQVTTAASQTQYRPANLTNQNNTAGYLGFSAEL